MNCVDAGGRVCNQRRCGGGESPKVVRVARNADGAVVPVLYALQDSGEDVASCRPADAEKYGYVILHVVDYIIFQPCPPTDRPPPTTTRPVTMGRVNRSKCPQKT